MEFSVWPNADESFAEIAATVEESERLGFHAAYLPDHFMPHGDGPASQRGAMLESATTLAALAQRTATIRIGILVASATYRHPAVYANAMCTIDRISGGRAIAGIGAGWQENEHASYGIALGSIAERIDRFEEYVTVVASMLAHDSTTFDGEYFTLRDAPCDPRPVQSPLPVLLGVRGRRRTMGIAARHAATWNAWATAEDLTELHATLDEWCNRVGRDPGDLRRSANAGLFLSDDEAWLSRYRADPAPGPTIVGRADEVAEAVAAYDAAGCDELILAFDTDGSTRHLDMLAMFAQDVVPSLR